MYDTVEKEKNLKYDKLHITPKHTFSSWLCPSSLKRHNFLWSKRYILRRTIFCFWWHKYFFSFQQSCNIYIPRYFSACTNGYVALWKGCDIEPHLICRLLVQLCRYFLSKIGGSGTSNANWKVLTNTNENEISQQKYKPFYDFDAIRFLLKTE